MKELPPHFSPWNHTRQVAHPLVLSLVTRHLRLINSYLSRCQLASSIPPRTQEGTAGHAGNKAVSFWGRTLSRRRNRSDSAVYIPTDAVSGSTFNHSLLHKVSAVPFRVRRKLFFLLAVVKWRRFIVSKWKLGAGRSTSKDPPSSLQILAVH